MNRLDLERSHPPQQPAVESKLTPSTLQSGRFQRRRHRLAHAIFCPEHYECGYAYPLLVWLHGNNVDERQILKVIPAISLRNFVAIAPRGTTPAWQVPGRDRENAGRSGYRWVQSGEDIVETQERVHECVALASQRFNVAPHRIFLAGEGCGGTMAIRLALNEPSCFAGAISLGGPFPDSMQPLRRINEIRDFPMLIAASRQSRRYPEPRVCHDLRLAHSAGLSFSLRQYAGPDGLTPKMLGDVNEWIMSIVCDQRGRQNA